MNDRPSFSIGREQVEDLIHQQRIYQRLRYVSARMKKKRAVIFYTWRRFEGNLKYAFIELVRHVREKRLDVDVRFLTLVREDYEALLAHDLPALLWREDAVKPFAELLQAQIVVTDGFLYDREPTPPELYAALAGAKTINLWHGTPIKQIHLQQIHHCTQVDLHTSAIWESAASVHTFCLASPRHRALFEQAFVVDHFRVTGYARNDVLLRAPTPQALINVDTALHEQLRALQAAGTKLFFYAPTWRANNPRWLSHELVAALAQCVQARGGCLVVNPHPFELPYLQDMLRSIEGVVLPQCPDVYPLLALADVLITDYSSILFDFSVTGRPVLLFRPDHDDYLRHSHPLTPEQEATLPYPVAGDVATLARQIDARLAGGASPAERLAARQHNRYLDANASARVANVLLRNLAPRGLARVRAALGFS